MSRKILSQYCEAGWALTFFDTGAKGPTRKAWNERRHAIMDPEVAEFSEGNVGLLHAYSGTCCLDVDDMEKATPWLAARGVDLAALLSTPGAVRIHSGREGRAKLLYKADKLRPSFNLSKLGAGIELRCASRNGLSVQDVLPPSIHPDTGRPYEWRYGGDSGHWSKLPKLPDGLKAIWDRLITPDTKIAEPKETVLPVQLGALRTMLYRHDPDCGYQDWVNAGMALHHETKGDMNGFALWDEWSRTGSKYKSKEDLITHWRSFGRATTPVTAASLRVDAPAEAEEFPIVTEAMVATTVQVAPAVKSAGGAPEMRDVDPDAVREVARLVRRDKQGMALATLPNITSILGHATLCSTRIAYDSFQDAMICAPVDRDEWRQLKDTDFTALRMWLETSMAFLPVSKEMVRDAVYYIGEQHEVDTAIVWLQSLQWDGVERIERFFPRYFGTADTAYERHVGLYTWTAAAGRVLDPGCQADMIPILVGAQGVGKSQGIKAMAPDPQHYVEIRLDDKEDDTSRRMRGALIGELAELRGLRTTDIERIKAFVTRTHEKWTPKFKEFAITFPRRLVMIGTSNDDDFLTDEENRRWLPMRVTKGDVEAIKRDRLQLWAEAAARWKQSGIQWERAQSMAVEKHAEFEAADVWEPEIRQWLEEANWPEVVRLHDVLLQAVGLDTRKINRTDERRGARIMKRCGYDRRTMRVNGRVQKAWALIEDTSTIDYEDELFQ